MQKIIACEHRSLPSFCTELCLNDCSFTALKSVSAAGPAACTACSDRALNLSIPVNVCTIDSCGRLFTLSSTVQAAIDPPCSCLCTDHPRSTLLILPCVRLLRADCTGGGCFRVQLHIQLEIYLLRYDICRCEPPKPSCPQLPLYPPPMC